MALTLRVKLNPNKPAMVPDFEAMEREPAVRRFIGGKVEALPDGGSKFVTVDEVVSVPFRSEYRDEVVAGHLVPCDEDSAKLCGVPLPVANKAAEKATKGSE